MNEPTSLYIHIPFCNSICDYCDFPKLQYFTIFSKPYLKALKEELESYNIGKLETIYVGGGTPTCLSNDEFKELLHIIKPYSNGVKEFTIECNPESLCVKKLELMKEYGVNRLSIGVESTNNEILKSINRHHTYEDVVKAISDARKIGFDNISVDLILGLPNVTKTMLKKDIQNILKLGVDHMSCYSLTVHPNTVFYINGITPLPSDMERELYDTANELLESNGFEHYEISSWSKPGKESKHNLVYWQNKEYYGAGLGASGYIGDVRYANTKNIHRYLNKEFINEKEMVSNSDKKEYQVMLNLRTRYGIDIEAFNKEFKSDLLIEKKQEIDDLIKENYLKMENNYLVPTYDGMMILDQIILKLI